MKKLINSFNKQPHALKILIVTALLMIIPFLESIIGSAFGFHYVTGWYDLTLISKIFILLASIPFSYFVYLLGLRPIYYWIKNIFNK